VKAGQPVALRSLISLRTRASRARASSTPNH
jgi:hypothetical protein